MLFIMLPTGHLRYFFAAQSDRGWVGLRLPDPVPTPGRSRPSAGWLFAVTVLPFSSVVFPRSPRQIAALGWVKANRPAAVLYSDSLRRHASFYWRERPTPSRRPTPTAINSGASSSQGALCCRPMPTSAGLAGQKSRRSSAKQESTTSIISSSFSSLAKATGPGLKPRR